MSTIRKFIALVLIALLFVMPMAYADREGKNKKEEKEDDEEYELSEGNLLVKVNAKGNMTDEQRSLIDYVVNLFKNQVGKLMIEISNKNGNSKIKIESETSKSREKEGDNDVERENKNGKKQNKAKGQIESAAKAISEAKAKLNASNATGNRIAIKLIAEAEKHFARAKEAFDEGKFGKAFGQAKSAERLAVNAKKIIGRGKLKDEIEKRSIYGFVFNDLDGNGARNYKDKGLANWTVFLDANGNGIFDGSELNATTNANGKYKFEGFAKGNYTVHEIVQQGWMATTSNPVSIELGNRGDIKANFGNFKLGEINGIKFENSDMDGTKDGNETLLANWTIKLSGPITALTITDSSGMYSFVDLTHGIYNISEVQQAGWNKTMPNGTYTVKITSGLVASGKDFGNFRSI